MFDKLSELSNQNDDKPIIDQLIAIHQLIGSIIEQMQQDSDSETDSPDNFGKNLQQEHPIAVIKKSLLAGVR